MNVLAGPYWDDHTRLAIMFIQDGHGEPGDESGEASAQARGHGSHPRQNRVAGEERRGPGSADDQINPPGADLDSQIGRGAF